MDRMTELNKLIAEGKGDAQFTPRITVREGSWAWHFPGGQIELHGKCALVSIHTCVAEYKKKLQRYYRFDAGEVETPFSKPQATESTPAIHENEYAELDYIPPREEFAAAEVGRAWILKVPPNKTRLGFIGYMRSKLDGSWKETYKWRWSVGQVWEQDPGYNKETSPACIRILKNELQNGSEHYAPPKYKGEVPPPPPKPITPPILIVKPEQPKPEEKPPVLEESTPLTMDESEFLELALKFYQTEEELTDDEWARVNDKALPRLAQRIKIRRKVNAELDKQLALIPQVTRPVVEKLLLEREYELAKLREELGGKLRAQSQPQSDIKIARMGD